MRAAAADLEFEDAARLRDEIKRLEALDLGLPTGPALAPNVAGRSLQEATPKSRGRGAWRPEPMGPGGGGRAPSKRDKRR